MGWQWHQLDHMQIICTLLQTDNHASTSPLNFLQAGCPSYRPTNSVKINKKKQIDRSRQKKTQLLRWSSGRQMHNKQSKGSKWNAYLLAVVRKPERAIHNLTTIGVSWLILHRNNWWYFLGIRSTGNKNINTDDENEKCTHCALHSNRTITTQYQ